MAILEGDSYSQQHIVVRDSNSFDSLRLIFASLVILTHSFALLRLADPLETLSGSRYDLGKVGVTGFFAISGFLVTRSWLNNPNPRRFVLARGLRIFPAFWAALIFSVLLASTLTGFDFLLNGYTWRWLLRNAVLIWKEYGALIPGAFESNPHPGGANGSLWTLTYELHCYAVVLLLGVCGFLKRKFFVALLCVALLGFYAKLIADGGSLYRLGYHELYLAFAIGMVIAANGYRWALLLTLGAGAIATIAVASELPGQRWLYAPLQMVLGLLLVRLGESQVMKNLRFSRGDYSYGMYVYAFPIQQLVVSLLGALASPYILFPVSLVLILPVAILSGHFIEKPAIQLGKRRSSNFPPTSGEIRSATQA